MDKYTILVCDDEKDLVSGLKIYLEVENYRVLEAYNGMQALDILKKEEVHLVLMDVMMPGISGIETVIKMRSMGIDVPVILLTAKSEDSDKILGLNCGADDYITKPYNTGEVQARVRSQLRRYKGEFRKDTDECLRIKDIELNRKTKLVTVAGEEIQLTPTEFKICSCSCPIRASCFPCRTFTKRSGTATPTVRRIPLRCTSATCGKKSNSILPSQSISRSSGARAIRLIRSRTHEINSKGSHSALDAHPSCGLFLLSFGLGGLYRLSERDLLCTK